MKIQRDCDGYRIIPDDVDVRLPMELHCARCGARERRCCKAASGKDARMPHLERDLAARRYSQLIGDKTDKELAHEDLLVLLWLYIDWYRITRQLTTEEKEFMADSIDAARERVDLIEGQESSPVERWWRE